MSLRTKFIWRFLPKKDRHLLLSLLSDIDRSAVDHILKNDSLYRSFFHKHKCIFTHIPKNAGTSVSKTLFNNNTISHTPISWFQLTEPDLFDQYFKFCIVRNPWDRILSSYTYFKSGAAKKKGKDWSDFTNNFPTFDDFISKWLTRENTDRSVIFTPQYKFICDKLGYPCMDLIARFENLEEDFKVICSRFSINEKLPQLNASTKRKHYASYYSDKSRQLVEDVYSRDIELFNYSFGK